MQLARIPYLECGASKLQLSHPLNKRNYVPLSEQAKKSQFHFNSESLPFITKHIGIHDESGSLNLEASYFKIIDTIWSEFSHRFLEYVSHQIFACSFTSIELLARQGRITTSLFFSQFNYQKYQ